MNELIVEIENQNDFYSKPVIGDVPTPKEEFRDTHLAGNVGNCQNCGAPLANDDKFCTNCGAKVDVELKCSKCGATIAQGDKFCTNCGNKL